MNIISSYKEHEVLGMEDLNVFRAHRRIDDDLEREDPTNTAIYRKH